MAIPILTTDFWSKPEPTGSVNSAVMRLMAQAGAAIQDRVEKAAIKTEAQLAAPGISRMLANGFQQIAAGDMSGFGAITQAQAMSSGNPLLAGMAKDAGSLGITLANNATQQAMLKERLDAQKALTTQEIEGRNQTAVIRGQVQTNVSSEKAYQAEYQAWQVDQAQKQEEAKMRGEKFIPSAPPQRRQSAQIGVSGTLPTGPGGGSIDPSGQNWPSVTNPGPNKNPSPTGNDPTSLKPDLPEGGIDLSLPQELVTEGANGKPQVPEGKAPTEATTQAAPAEQTEAITASGKPAGMIELSLGDKKFVIPNVVDEDVTIRNKTTGISKSFKKTDDGPKIDRFVKGVGVINSDPYMAKALGDYFPGSAGKGLVFTQSATKGEYNVYGVDKEGNNKQIMSTSKSEDGKPISAPLSVSDEVRKAYVEDFSGNLAVAQKIGVRPLVNEKGQDEKKGPQLDDIDKKIQPVFEKSILPVYKELKLSPEDAAPYTKRMQQLFVDTQSKLDAKQIDETRAREIVNNGIKEIAKDVKKDHALKADMKGYGIDDGKIAAEETQTKERDNSSKIKALKEKIDKLDQQLKSKVGEPSLSVDERPAYGDSGFTYATKKLTEKQRRELVVIRRNLIGQLEDLTD